MRPIVRSAEPAAFTAWKALASPDWQPSWDNFQKPEKPEVLTALLRDQGFVCSYCEQRVDMRGSHIEHLESRHAAPHRALEFSNLLASCQGELPREPAHCGHLKGHEPLGVHPLLPECREYFIFDSAGGIRSSPDPARAASAQHAIATLGLGIPKLMAMRRAAIEGAMALLQEGASDEEIRRFIAVIDDRDAAGQHTPFASAIVQFLTAYLVPAPAS
ncbi:retron system putative HNH endonuclease [Hyalangium versicolor]|uniref:retron system putative HNH endonuclease n=1 Tax=Hyalangium versicolor TaxID=2861190 RepID=UPI001CCCD61E|nr:retron system putative HNH endonuclease [Hyalangium versicolor]